jgi:methyl-accepting chemotaxis protein
MNFFRNIIQNIKSIRLKGMFGKMILIAITPIVLMSIGAVFILFNVQSVSSRLTSILTETVPAITNSKDMVVEIRTMDLNIWKILYYQGKPDEAQAYIFDFEDSMSRFNGDLDRSKQLKMPELVAKLRDETVAKWTKFSPDFAEFKKAMTDKDFKNIEKLYDTKIKNNLTEMINTLSNVELNNINLIETERESAGKLAAKVTKNSLLVGSVAAFISIILAFFITSNMTNKMLKITESLKEQSDFTQHQSMEMANQSNKLAQASTQAASAIQQTSAAMTEMKATAAKSGESAQTTSNVSKDSNESLAAGKETIDETKESFMEIQKANETMMTVVDENNKRMLEILDVIKTIDAKTVMINDIVFQTKLLSFNASVEAARAGEAGKGFAVVAEEVGKLALSSGNASSEISKILKESHIKVEHIVQQTKTDMARVSSGIENKVKESEKNIQSTFLLFDNLQEKNENVSQLILEIMHGMDEQIKGINEITNSMEELSTISNQNMQGSQQIANSADLILKNTQIVNDISGDLKTIVIG